jgi:hypothetical protein
VVLTVLRTVFTEFGEILYRSTPYNAIEYL